MQHFPLQLILFGQVDDLYIDLDPVRGLFEDCIQIAESGLTADALMDKVYESRSAHIYPSLLCLYLADKHGVQAWQLFSHCLKILKEKDPFSFLIVLTQEETLPFDQSLWPNDQTVWSISRKNFENNPVQLVEYADHYLRMLSLISPDEIFMPTTFKSCSNFLTVKNLVQGRYTGTKVLSDLLDQKQTIPCFNIKSPSMIDSILIAAENSRSPVILEISPSEIMRYFPSHPVGNFGFQAAREKLFSGLKIFKKLIDDAMDRLSVKIPVFIHLDHATSPEIVLFCIDQGYDMVMYDGSHRSFNSNLRTTSWLVEEAHKKGVMFEAEFSGVDRTIPRTTSKERVVEFVKQSKVDLLGISVGQKHGSDYQFESLLKAHNELAASFHTLTQGRSRIMVEAIEEVLKEVKDFSQRQYLEHLRFMVIFKGQLPFNDKFPFHERFPFADVSMKVWRLMTEKENAMVSLLVRLNHKINNISINFSKPDIKRNIDWVGLGEIQRVIINEIDHPMGLVIHGGSSIDVRSFKYFKSYNVKKINFGSSVFRNFLSSLLEMARLNHTHLPAQAHELTMSDIHLLLDFDWQNRGKAFVSPYIQFAPFIDYIERFYFRPLAEAEVDTTASSQMPTQIVRLNSEWESHEPQLFTCASTPIGVERTT